MFQPGDYVYPSNLPRRVLCRVADTEVAQTRTGTFQILTLEPLEGPLAEAATSHLLRFDDDVLPASARDLWLRCPAGAHAD